MTEFLAVPASEESLWTPLTGEATVSATLPSLLLPFDMVRPAGVRAVGVLAPASEGPPAAGSK